MKFLSFAHILLCHLKYIGMSLKFSGISISKFDEVFLAFFLVSVKGLGQNGCDDWLSISKVNSKNEILYIGM